MKEFILEILTEELPADYLKPAAAQLKEKTEKGLKEKRIGFDSAEVLYTVRRLVLRVKGVPARQEDISFVKKGPRHDIAYENGKLTAIGKKFLEANGLAEGEIKIREEGGKKFLEAEISEKGIKTEKVLKDILPGITASISFPKSMAWEASKARFARPVRSILCMLDDAVIPFVFAGVKASRKLYGHKYHGSGKPLLLKTAGAYFAAVKKAGVIIRQEDREAAVKAALEAALEKQGLKLLEDAELLEKVASSVEAVSVNTGEFDAKYLGLPGEVTVTAMREHQRYFAAVKKGGAFTNTFLNVRDGGVKNSAVIAKQHAKVLFARLNDAEFFYNEDLKVPLENNVEKLKDAVFISGLGSMHDKTMRLKALAEKAAELFGYDDTAALAEAAFLSKADLVTNMAGEKEFAELRGIIGGIYLEKQGKPEKIYRAVAGHYLPNAAGDKLPGTREALILSVLDKLDNLTGFYIAGFKPTGSKDPYAVRRQALNIIYIITEKKLDIRLRKLIDAVNGVYNENMGKSADAGEIEVFFRQRQENYFKERGIDYDIVAAVSGGAGLNVLENYEKALAISAARKNPGFNETVFAAARISNILPQDYEGKGVDPGLFDCEDEKALYRAFADSRGAMEEELNARNYAECYGVINRLKPLISAYFDRVLVNSPDAAKKTNRLNMLSEMKEVIYRLCDFSKVVIDRD